MKRFICVLVSLGLDAVLGGCAQSSGGASESQPSDSGSSAIVETSSSDVSDPVSDEYALPETVFGIPERVISKNGSGQMIGLCAVFHADSTDCTDESLATWFDEYVRFSAEDWCVVVFGDKPGYGIYANNEMVDANVRIEENSDGTYSESDDSEAVFYVFSKDKQSLVRLG